jgi:hypothetical protein
MRTHTPSEKAREYAKSRGYLVRRVPHSQQYPNGYIKIITPTGEELQASDWTRAYLTMIELHSKVLKRGSKKR